MPKRTGPPPPTLPSGPAGRPAAPGPLGILQAFVNTVDLEHDRHAFHDAEGLARWLTAHGLLAASVSLDRRDLAEAVRVREALRALLGANRGGPGASEAARLLEKVVARAPLGVAFAADGVRLTPGGAGLDRALAALVATAYDAMRDGTWRRLKTCPRCHWAFYDTSRNRSSTWCAMAICGSRSKAEAYRRRQHLPP